MKLTREFPSNYTMAQWQTADHADAQVVGVPCEYYGEEPVGFIRLKRGESVSSLELKKYCRERIAIHKVPVSFLFVEEYPLTASGKVQKFKLRELALENLTKQ